MKKVKLMIGGLATLIAISPLGLKATPFNPVQYNSTLSTKSNVVAKPIFKVGNTYTVKGVTYTPGLNNDYDELGVASWYGEEFHGKLTSNGEIFNKDLVTAASTILPLPSIVEITNLDNGIKLLVRVNDRGPYATGRIIDVSEKAAELLGFKDEGTARVRVRIVPDLSLKVAKQMPNYHKVMASLNPNSSSTTTTLGAHESIMQPSVMPVEEAHAIPVNYNSGNIGVKKDTFNAQVDNTNTYPPAIKINSSNLKQVSLVEPNSIQQYIPRGVFVQVGAFDNNNTKIREDLNFLSKVGVVTLQSIDINGKNVLRVRVGPYGSIEDASKIRSSLVRLGYKDPRVVIED